MTSFILYNILDDLIPRNTIVLRPHLLQGTSACFLGEADSSNLKVLADDRGMYFILNTE